MTALLEVTGLRKRFGGLVAVDGVSFQVPQGIIAGLIGPNGAGKTTLFNLISGFLKPDEGTIRFHGRNLTALAPARIARCGLVRTFQLVRTFPDLTVLENVLVGHHQTTRGGVWAAALRPSWYRRQEAEVYENALALLDQVGLRAQAHMPAGSLPLASQRALEIARGLAAGPKMLLIDEPAAGLNPSDTAHLADLLRSVRDRGITVLLVDHDMEFIMNLVNWVYVLNFGQLIAQGTPAQVQANPVVLQAYLGTDDEEEV